MTIKPIKELFYSNGIEIFGPISYKDFCENKYYKSTMIWHEGLDGWINICEVEEMKHLVGTMSTPNLDSIQPQESENLTPPLSKTVQASVPSKKNSKTKRWLLLGVGIILLLVGYFILGDKNQSNSDNIIVEDVDSLTNNVQKDTNQNITEIDTNAIIDDATKEAEKKMHRMNWEKFVTVKTNNYRKIEIGGIDNLKIMVTNTSLYKIDFVTVYVEYLKASGDTAQTAVLEFHDLKPNETKELHAPDSKRGVNILANIINVKSYGMNFCWDRKIASTKGEDPFKCRK